MEKLKPHFDDLFYLIQDSFISYQILFIIDDKKTQIELLNKDFFRFIGYQQFFMLNIQLAKILDCKKSQKRNIIKLCNDLINDNYKQEILIYYKKLQPSITYINKNYEQYIENVREVLTKVRGINKVIKKLSDARNKVYAHTDFEVNINFLTLHELKQLLDFAAYAYNVIRGELYGIKTDFTKGLVDLTILDVIQNIQRGLSLE